MEQNFFEPELHFDSKWKSISAATTVSDNGDGGFDCNICLESAHEPVVTLCGHLYCWPCIYKWLNVQISTDEPDEQPKCPVCKANISQASLVPLYGRGSSSSSDSKGKKPNLGLVIPNRPPPSGLNSLIATTTSASHSSQQMHPSYFESQAESYHHQQFFPHLHGGYAADASAHHGGTAMTSFSNPTIGMFGEMVYARIFGSSDSSLYSYPYTSSYPLTGISNPRIRRQEMHLDKKHMEHNFFEPELHFDSKWKSISAPTTVSDNGDGGFDCNICLESAHEPVITLCGHLYCWPCIYKWLNVQISTDELEEQPKCPVCKANISQASLVPLYGRGSSSSSDSKGRKPNLGLVIPNRPPPSGLNSLITTTTSASHSSQQMHPSYFESQAESYHHQQFFPHLHGGYAADASAHHGGTAMTSFSNPTIGMFGEMVYARIFGSSDPSLYSYPYTSSYPLTGIRSPRIRRQEMHLDKSLNRLSFFLFCCGMLCLLFF